jgi:hypothetical protein
MENPVVLRQCFVWQALQQLATQNGGKVPQVLRNGDIIKITDKKNNEVWQISSIQNNQRDGVLLELTHPSNAKPRCGKPYVCIKGLSTLLKKKALTIPNYTLTGVPSCPITTLKSPGTKTSKSTVKTDSSSK